MKILLKTCKKTLKLTFFLLALVLMARAETASAAMLEKTSTEMFSTGHTRVVKCSVSANAVSITRTFEGLTSTETKNFTLAGDLDSKIDDATATKATEQKSNPSVDLSFAYLAYKTGSSTPVVLTSYDGATGVEVYNPSAGAGVLREIMLSICGKE